MNGHLYTKEVIDRAVSKNSLNNRLDMNKKFQSTDFDSWLMARLNPQAGEDILDVEYGADEMSFRFKKRGIGKVRTFGCRVDPDDKQIKAVIL